MLYNLSGWEISWVSNSVARREAFSMILLLHSNSVYKQKGEHNYMRKKKFVVALMKSF